jgi:hypothetical protein
VPAFFPGVLQETAAGGFPSSSDGKRDGGIFPVTGVGGLSRSTSFSFAIVRCP